MHLEKLFHLYLGQAKKRVLTLHDNERTRACQWIKKIELAPNKEEQLKILQLHSLKLLLLSLESNCLTGPFEEPPVDDKEFAQYNWDSYQLADFSNMIRAQQDKRKCPEVSYAVSGNRRELVTYQNDPATGQHCYYACSKQPIEDWKNLQGGVFKNESIEQWKRCGELEELNPKESQNSSFDIPRCAEHNTSYGHDLNANDDRYIDSNPSRSGRIQNSSNDYPSAGPSRYTNKQGLHTGRPETPQIFGGSGQTRPYENQQFELSHTEPFRSPRGVFQNLDYDRSQTRMSPIQPRLTDEVIESFDNARLRRRDPLSEVKQNAAKQQLCDRLQTVRDGMNKKPQIEIEQEIEIEPERVVFERITLQEPCEDVSRHQETEHDLGILSTGDMDDEALFGDHQTIDPRTIFKTKDENLVSRNMVKIETNTTIDGSKREVTEEILEQEDVNIVEISENDENFVDASEFAPNLEDPLCSPKPEQGNKRLRDHRLPRQIDHCGHFKRREPMSFVNESDKFNDFCRSNQRAMTHKDTTERVDQFSHPSFAASFEDSGVPLRPVICTSPLRHLPQLNTSEILDEVSQPAFLHSTELSYQDSSRTGRCPTRQIPLPQVDTSQRLDQICQSKFLPSIEDSYEDSTRRNRCTSNQRGIPQIDTSERLDQISHPSFAASFEDSGVSSRRGRCTQPRRRLPQVDTSEILDQVSQPGFLHSKEVSCQDSTRRPRCLTRQRPLHQMDTSQRLDQISQPKFLSSIEDSYQDSTRRRRCPSNQRAMPQIDTSERLDQISHPGFATSFEDSGIPSRRGRCTSPLRRLPQLDTSERLDEVSQPGFLHSTEVSCQDSTRMGRCPTRQRALPQVDTSQRLDQISQPKFLSSMEDSYPDSTRRRSGPSNQRGMPQIDTPERLDQISHAGFATSFEDSGVSSRRGRCTPPLGHLPQVDTSERLDEVSQPGMFHSKQASCQDSTRMGRCTTRQRALPQMDTSQRLDQISQPKFLSSMEDSYPDSTRRRSGPSNQGGMPQIDTSERLDQISHPGFATSCEDSGASSRRGRLTPAFGHIPQEDSSERLDEVSQPGLLHSAEISCQDSTRRGRCPTRQRTLPKVDNSQRLDQISQPNYLSSIEDSYEDSKRRGRFPSYQRGMPQIDTSERLDQISNPGLATSFEDSGVSSRRGRCTPPLGHLPQVDISERLDEVSQPGIFHSKAASCQDSTRRDKCSIRQRTLPQVDTSQRLNQISKPKCMSSIEGSYDGRTRRNQCPSKQKAMLQIDTSEKLNEISHPSFAASFEDSGVPSRRGRCTSPLRSLPHLDTSERLDEVSQPAFLHSTEVSCPDSTRRGRCPTRQRPLPQVDTSQRLDEISQPKFLSSIEDSYQDYTRRRRCPSNQRGMPQIDTSERLDQISHPGFAASLQDSTVPSRRVRTMSPYRHLPQVDASEELVQVTQPRFLSSIEDSNKDFKYKCPLYHRTLPQVNKSEQLDQVSQPAHMRNSSFKSSDGKRTTSSYTAEPQIGTCEYLDQVSRPQYMSPFDYSRDYKQMQSDIFNSKVVDSEILDNVCQPEFELSLGDSSCKSKEIGQAPGILPHVNNSEQLDDICQPEYPSTLQTSSVHHTRISQGTPKQKRFSPVVVSERLENICEPEFTSSFEDSKQRSRRQTQMNVSERLDDISQPFCSSIEDSAPAHRLRVNAATSIISDQANQQDCSSNYYRNTQPQRPLPQVEESENLDAVIQPDLGSFEDTGYGSKEELENLEDISAPNFLSSYRDSILRSRENRRTQEQRPLPVVDVSERLDNICQPDFSSFQSSFENPNHTLKSSKRSACPHIRRTEQNPTQKLISRVDASEILDNISHPFHQSSFEDSVYDLEKTHRQDYLGDGFHPDYTLNRHFPQVSEMEHLDNVTQPVFQSTLEDTNISRMTPHSRASNKRDTTERLNDVSRPSFPTSFEDSVKISRRYIDVSEKLEDVCQPSFPISLEDSSRYSRRHNSRPNEELCRGEIQPNVDQLYVSSALDRSDRQSRSLPVQTPNRFDTSEMLEHVTQPEFPSTLQGTMNFSSNRRKLGVAKRGIPQMDLSENIESICQPEFPVSFEDSSRSLTYRQTKDCATNYPNENLADVSAPNFDSNNEESMQKRCGSLYLTQENLEDISCPSFKTTPKLQQRRREDYQSRGPPRQLFPNHISTRECCERSGDFRQAFETLPNYAPFKEQVASNRNPIASKLKMPVTFGHTEMEYSRPQSQPSQPNKMPTRPVTRPSNKHNTIPTQDCRANQMRPPTTSQGNPCKLQIPSHRDQMEPRQPARKVSATRIPLPPSARSQTNIQREDQRSKIEMPANQERLVKKSSVKYHQTKSTYSKNK